MRFFFPFFFALLDFLLPERDRALPRLPRLPRELFEALELSSLSSLSSSTA
jgi:hypothetical protein